MYLPQLAPRHNQPQVTGSLIVLSLHDKEDKHPISHGQVAQHSTQIQRHDQDNPDLSLYFLIRLQLKEGTHISNLNRENLT